MLNYFLTLLVVLSTLVGSLVQANNSSHKYKDELIELMISQVPTANKSDERVFLLEYKIKPDWHIYWKNYGDSGAAPIVSLEGANLKEILWPFPYRYVVADLHNFGYADQVTFPIKVNQLDASGKIKFDLEWLVCKIECIPGFAEISYNLAEENVNSAEAARIETEYKNALLRVPQVKSDWNVRSVDIENNQLRYRLYLPKNIPVDSIQNIEVFPEEFGLVSNTPASVGDVNTTENYFELTQNLDVNRPSEKTSLMQTVVLQSKDGSHETASVHTPVQSAPPNYLAALLFAFLGGMILNLMPCVFPILSLKAFSFIKSSDSQQIKKSTWLYTFGVLASFLTIGAVLSALRLSGESIGWGFQLQNPLIVYILVLLFFVLALNFFGLFEMGDLVANWFSGKANNKFFSSDFGTGVLAVVVASPCTAPFMGGALGMTLILPIPMSLGIFLALGAGLAAPLLLLAYVPNLAEKMPRSGAWMITFKQFMGFPLLATVLWLLWVLSLQIGDSQFWLVLISLLILAFLIWMNSVSQSRNMKRSILTLGLLMLFYVGTALRAEPQSAKTGAASNWQGYSKNLIEENKGKKAIFVDFTAAWCVTCQVNKRLVLDTDEIQSEFKKRDVLLIRADWTNKDPAITEALAAFGRNSVPFYVFYDKDKNSKILPELLTKQMVYDLFSKEE